MRGWCDPKAQGSRVLMEFTGCYVGMSPAHAHIEVRDQDLITTPLLTAYTSSKGVTLLVTFN